MRRIFLDEPENPDRPAHSFIGNMVVLALTITSVILHLIMGSRLPALADWRFDSTNTNQTIGQTAFFLTVAAPVSLILARRWFAVVETNTWLLFFLLGAYAWLNSSAMIVALKFWAEPRHAELNRDTLHRLPLAVGVYLVVCAAFRYRYYSEHPG